MYPVCAGLERCSITGGMTQGWVKDCRDFWVPCPTYITPAVLTSSPQNAMRLDSENISPGLSRPAQELMHRGQPPGCRGVADISL